LALVIGLMIQVPLVNFIPGLVGLGVLGLLLQSRWHQFA